MRGFPRADGEIRTPDPFKIPADEQVRQARASGAEADAI
jgi:hypothetical protein